MKQILLEAFLLPDNKMWIVIGLGLMGVFFFVKYNINISQETKRRFKENPFGFLREEAMNKLAKKRK
jgi:hypothetical protein